jgi:hypothetical protein
MSRPRFQGSHSHSLLSTHIYMETDTYMVLIQAISCMSYCQIGDLHVKLAFNS